MTKKIDPKSCEKCKKRQVLSKVEGSSPEISLVAIWCPPCKYQYSEVEVEKIAKVDKVEKAA
jgi:thiol-disulfide isomerase/thioredoxin